MKIDFLKCHASGGEFALIDDMETNSFIFEDLNSKISRALCDPSGAVAVESVIFLRKDIDADAEMRVYTPDGFETPLCVNALFCSARFLFKKYSSKKKIAIKTLAGIFIVSEESEFFKNVKAFSVNDIKPFQTSPKNIPIIIDTDEVLNTKISKISNKYSFSAVNIFTPHIISVVDSIDENELVEIGEKANIDRFMFPVGINVTFVKIIDNENIYVRTYERCNIGLSKSCSSAMAASCYILAKLNIIHFDRSINVYNKGGLGKCTVKANDGVPCCNMTGNANFVYEGSITFDIENGTFGEIMSGNLYLNELTSYDDFWEWTKKQCMESSFLKEINKNNYH